jgi:hypothetical protein
MQVAGPRIDAYRRSSVRMGDTPLPVELPASECGYHAARAKRTTLSLSYSD